jgi:hypothetical protein
MVPLKLFLYCCLTSCLEMDIAPSEEVYATIFVRLPDGFRVAGQFSASAKVRDCSTRAPSHFCGHKVGSHLRLGVGG